MIKLDIVDNKKQHFLVSADEPMRIEVSVINGSVIAHGYSGLETDLEQDPDICYDGTCADEMQEQKSERLAS